MTLLGAVSSVQNLFFTSIKLTIINFIPLYRVKKPKFTTFSKKTNSNKHILTEGLNIMPNALWGRWLTLTSFTPHLFLLGWLKLNLALLLDQLRLA